MIFKLEKVLHRAIQITLLTMESCTYLETSFLRSPHLRTLQASPASLGSSSQETKKMKLGSKKNGIANRCRDGKMGRFGAFFGGRTDLVTDGKCERPKGTGI